MQRYTLLSFTFGLYRFQRFIGMGKNSFNLRMAVCKTGMLKLILYIIYRIQDSQLLPLSIYINTGILFAIFISFFTF